MIEPGEARSRNITRRSSSDWPRRLVESPRIDHMHIHLRPGRSSVLVFMYINTHISWYWADEVKCHRMVGCAMTEALITNNPL